MPLPIDARGRTLRSVSGTNVTAALPWAIKPSELKSIARLIMTNGEVKATVGRNRHRLLSLEPLIESTKDGPPTAPTRWRGLVYDYGQNRALVVTTGVGARPRLELAVRRAQPLPSPEEWDEAVEILRADPELGPRLARGEIGPYRAMPPLAEREGPLGEIERALHVGLRPLRGSRFANTIVAVNLIRRAVERYEKGSPPTARAEASMCGAPDPDFFASPPRGTAGSCWISWPAKDPVWRFLAVRPAASSGTRGSGIEIRYADYMGKRVLYHGHVPILNVLYDGDACGPYRDWQWQEHNFQADGVDIAPGFRWCNAPPQTIIESGSDTGNFNGVAIHETESELRLVSEMEAGWYRYISEWRFDKLGTIRPRFGFSATANSCVCNVHHHHCYWRLDLDLDGAGNDAVDEWNDGQNWQPLAHEVRRPRNPASNRMWRVRDNGPDALTYLIVPGADDGLADAYGRGDLWFTRYRGGELDDGYNQTGGSGTAANIDKFVNGESIDKQDVVVWYGAHFRHELGHDDHGHGEMLGPTLMQPIRCFFNARTSQLRLTARDLDDLRAFRDRDLRASPVAAKYVEALERHAPELVQLASGDRSLEALMAELAGGLVQVVRTRGARRPAPVAAELLDAARRLLDRLASSGSEPLRATVKGATEDLARFTGKTLAEGVAKLRGPR